MNVGFYIAILKVDEIAGHRFQQDSFNWQGVNYPQLPVYMQLPTIKVVELPMTSVLGGLPEPFPLDDWMGLKVDSDNLEAYYKAICCEEPEWTDEKQNAERFVVAFEKDLQLILDGTPKWFLIFIPDEEYISTFNVETASQTVARLRHELNRIDWRHRGFISASPGSGVHFEIFV